MLNKKTNQLPEQRTKEPKQTLSNFRVWQTKDIESHDLLSHIDKEIDTIKNSATSLFDEDKSIPTSNKSKPTKSLMFNSQSMNNLQLVSPKSQRMLHNAYRTIKSITNSTNEIMQLNSLYFSQGKIPTSPSNTNTNANATDDNHSNKKPLPKIQIARKKNNIANFHYVTNNFRKQLNKAFMNFNPLIHLENMKLLQEADPDINEDITKLKEVITDDLAEITDKHYHRNRYQEYIKKKKLTIQSSPINCFGLVKELQNEEKTKCISTRGGKKITKSMPYLFNTKSNNLFSETRKKLPFKDLRLKELETMQNSLQLINDILTEDSIATNIKEVKKDQKELFAKHNRQYKSQFNNVDETLKDIHKLKLKNGYKEEGATILNKIKKENELYLKHLPGMKQILLHEINNTIPKLSN